MMRKQHIKSKLIYEVGINDYDGRVSIDGKMIRSYNTWTSMLQRCYDSKCQIKQPTYTGCTVCAEWLSFSNFKVWFDNHYREGFSLDKDVLIKNNKVYSPETCRFIPQSLNQLLVKRNSKRGLYPIGVYYMKVVKKFKAQCNNGTGTQVYLGCFDNQLDAFDHYKSFKESIIKVKATEHYLAGEIDYETYAALFNYEVEMTD